MSYQVLIYKTTVSYALKIVSFLQFTFISGQLSFDQLNTLCLKLKYFLPAYFRKDNRIPLLQSVQPTINATEISI